MDNDSRVIIIQLVPMRHVVAILLEYENMGDMMIVLHVVKILGLAEYELNWYLTLFEYNASYCLIPLLVQG